MEKIFEDCDFSGSVFRKANLQAVTFNNVNLGKAAFDDVNLGEAIIHNANLCNLKIEDAFIGGMTVDGMRIDQLIEAERDRRDPERVRLRMNDPYDPECVRGVLKHLDELRVEFMAFLCSLDQTKLVTRPAPEEWSALECVRHLVFAEDLYLNRWLLQNERPWVHEGLLPGFLAGQANYKEVGSQPPSDLASVLAAWDDLHRQTWQLVDRVTPEDLHRDTSQVDFGQGDAGKVLQGLAQHDLVHIRQAEAAVACLKERQPTLN